MDLANSTSGVDSTFGEAGTDREEAAEDGHNGLCVASRRDAGMTEARDARLCL